MAEILLQRTTAASVARSYDGFFQHYPSWAVLVHAPLGNIETVLRSLGLWRHKAEALQLLAQPIEQ